MSKFYGNKESEYPDIGQKNNENPYSGNSNSLITQMDLPKATSTERVQNKQACAIQFF